MYTKKPNQIGVKYNKLLLIGDINEPGPRKCKFQCECGNIAIKTLNSVKTGHTKSCGCLGKQGNKSHGMSYSKFYKVLDQIKGRLKPTHQHYKYYGAKGIKCEWKNFKEFYDDMYESYLVHLKKHGEKQTTIDRINSDGNYSKENCRWATLKQQQQNRKQSLYYKGKHLMYYVRIYNINEHTLRSRMRQFRLSNNVSSQDACNYILKHQYNL